MSDPVTYEIVYMNKLLRESLGYEEEKEYVGRKCYEVLQGYNQPAPSVPIQFWNLGNLFPGPTRIPF